MRDKKILNSSTVVVLLVFISAGLYISGVVNGTVKTSIVTWVVVVISTILNLIIVVKDKGFNLSSNIVIVSGVIGQIAILVSVLVVGATVRLNLFDVYVFIVSVFAFIVYLLNQRRACSKCYRYKSCSYDWFCSFVETFTKWWCYRIVVCLDFYNNSISHWIKKSSKMQI